MEEKRNTSDHDQKKCQEVKSVTLAVERNS